MSENVGGGIVGQDKAVIALAIHALGPHLDLLLRLFARNVKYLFVRKRERDLQHQRGLADARLTANQHQGATHDPAAQHAVQLDIGRADARFLLVFYFGDRLGLARKRHRLPDYWPIFVFFLD